MPHCNGTDKKKQSILEFKPTTGFMSSVSVMLIIFFN